MIEIAWPWIFCLLPLPLLLRLLLPKALLTEAAALFAPFVLNLQLTDKTGGPRATEMWRIALATLIWLLLVCAAANPRWLGQPVELAETGRSLMLAVDISESMQIPDLDQSGSQVNRLEVVKEVAGQFLEHRTGDRLGLILFGTEAYLQAPLTFDRTTVRTLLEEAVIGMAGKKTAIGDAIGLAVKRLREAPQGKAVLILITDGANTAGMVPPRRAAELAASAGLRIHTIGVGADRMYVASLFGTQTFNPSQDLDEETLKFIATTTGGVYFRAKDRDGLESVYKQLDELEPVEAGSRVVRPVTSLYPWPLAAAFLLSLAWPLFSGLRNLWERQRS